MQSHPQSAAPGNAFPPRRERRPSRRSHWTRRRKIAIVIVALILSTPLLAAGWYVWNITDAIGDAQSVSVMDLPERNVPQSSDDGAAGGANTPATPQAQAQDPQQSPTKTPNDNPSSFDVARGLFSAGTGGENTSPDKVWPDRDHINVMVLGVDTRPDGGDQNADVIIIARIDLNQRTMRSVSIPRDLQVEIPGHGPGKINGAYGIGIEAEPDNRVAGVAMMRDTIEHNFGIPIDDYVLVDFEGFTEVVDAVGGITINVPTRIEDPEFPTEDYGTRTLVIEAGRQEMDGETALAYARTRHGDSDDQRRERQMLVIQALFEQGRDLGTLTRVADVITAVSGAALTSFHWDEQLALASIALEMNSNGVEMRNLEQPLIQPGTAADGAWIYVGDISAISSFIESTLSGEEPLTSGAGPVGS